MPTLETISRLVELLNPSGNILYDMSIEEARSIVAGGEADAVGRIAGQFALVARDGTTVRMARTMGL